MTCTLICKLSGIELNKNLPVSFQFKLGKKSRMLFIPPYILIKTNEIRQKRKKKKQSWVKCNHNGA